MRRKAMGSAAGSTEELGSRRRNAGMNQKPGWCAFAQNQEMIASKPANRNQKWRFSEGAAGSIDIRMGTAMRKKYSGIAPPWRRKYLAGRISWPWPDPAPAM